MYRIRFKCLLSTYSITFLGLLVDLYYLPLNIAFKYDNLGIILFMKFTFLIKCDVKLQTIWKRRRNEGFI